MLQNVYYLIVFIVSCCDVRPTRVFSDSDCYGCDTRWQETKLQLKQTVSGNPYDNLPNYNNNLFVIFWKENVIECSLYYIGRLFTCSFDARDTYSHSNVCIIVLTNLLHFIFLLIILSGYKTHYKLFRRMCYIQHCIRKLESLSN